MYNNLAIDVNCKAALYIRLSQEDRDKKFESDSESVKNQREILNKYCNQHNIKVVDEYVDDGYSGTDFERPAFQRMISDVEDGRVNCVIVKDLSRLGRDHIVTGYYMEIYFPEKGIRFISITESYDSGSNQTNDTTGFILTCNDWYSKQNSIKIKSVLDSKRRDGKYVGSSPCYGYMRDPLDKNHLVPDQNAPIVKMMFKWLEEDVGVSEITTRLNDMKIPTPSAVKNIKHSSRCKENSFWTISSVRKILGNRMYTGDMVQRKQAKVSYKSKKKITLDENMWIIVENTHEPIVDKEKFFYLQSKMRRPKVRTIQRDKRLFENLLFCEECGNQLSVLYRINHNYWTVNCNKYSRDPKRAMCSPHFFPYDYLEEQILEKVLLALQVFIKELDFNELNTKVKEGIQKRKNNIKVVKVDYYSEKEKLLMQMHNLYSDKCSGAISMDMYRMLSEPLEKKIIELEKLIDIEKKNKKVEDYKKKKEKEYIGIIKQLLDLNTPNRELMLAVIDRIDITTDRKITIKYKYGFIPNDKFYYKQKTGPRNPYGKKGKKHTEFNTN